MNLRREAIASSDYWEFQPGERVMTIDGYPGVVELVEDGPIAGAENYVVKLDNGLGGGNYSASMLTKMPTSRSAAGIHLATDDYPELGTVIEDRPDPGKMSFTAALSEERQEADAEDHDEPGGDDRPHSCSYCGGTDFQDLTDNGRVRQATCATCNGTMSAHPGAQWTPELIGDPSNHPKAIIDPRSGASPGAGAPGQAGINDFIDYNSRVSTTAAAGTPAWTFQHREEETGGTKHPVEHHLTAHHPETGEQTGYASYYPPKRKNAPIGVKSVEGDHPGAASALMGEIESRHPGSPTTFVNEHQRDKNTPSHTNGEHGKPTDWDEWHPKLPEQMHRGFALRVDPWHGRALSKPGSSKQEHLDALHHSLPEGPNVGMHWTSDQDKAHRFAQNGGNDPRSDVPVVLHAKKPEKKDIETRPKELFRHGVFPYDSWNDEFEVPMRRGRQVHVTGISWKPDVEHPDADEHGWLHHTYGEDEGKQHTASQGPVNATLLKIAGVPQLMPERVASDATTAPEVAVKEAMQRLASQMADTLGPGSANLPVQRVAVVHEAGHLDLYHRTTPEAAETIRSERSMRSKENTGETYWSTFRGDEPDAQAHGYGAGTVHIRVPHHLAEIEDEFPSGEEHYRVHPSKIEPHHFVEG